MLKDLFGKKNNNNDYQRQKHDYFADEMNSYISDRDADYNYPGNYAGDDDSKYDYYTDDDFKDEYEKTHVESSDENELVYVVPDREKTTGKVEEIDGDKVRISYKIKGNDYVLEYEKGKNEYFAVGQVLNLGYISNTPDKAYLLPNNNTNVDLIKQLTQGNRQSTAMSTDSVNKTVLGYNMPMFGGIKTPSTKANDFDAEAEERYAMAILEGYERDSWCKGCGVISDVNDDGIIITYNVKGKDYKIELSVSDKDKYKMGTVVSLQYKQKIPDIYEILEIKDHSNDDPFDNIIEEKKDTNQGLFGGLFSNSGYGGMQALGGYGGTQTFSGKQANGNKSSKVEVVEWGETYGMIAEDNGEKVKVAYAVDGQTYFVWVTKAKNSWKVGLRMKVKYNYSSPEISSVLDMGNEHLTNRLKEKAEKEEQARRSSEIIRRSNRRYDSPLDVGVDIGLDLLEGFLNK